MLASQSALIGRGDHLSAFQALRGGDRLALFSVGSFIRNLCFSSQVASQLIPPHAVQLTFLPGVFFVVLVATLLPRPWEPFQWELDLILQLSFLFASRPGY